MPPSSLSRAIFSQLLAGRSLRHAGCNALRRSLVRQRCKFSSLPASRQRRTFFGISLMNQRKRSGATKAKLEPGIAKLQEHSKRLRVSARLNPIEEVRKALVDFITYKERDRSEVRDQHITLLLQGYEYLRAEREAGSKDAFMTKAELRLALKVLGQGKKHAQFEQEESRLSGHLILMIFVDLLKVLHHTNMPVNKSDVYACIVALCHCGQAAKARDVLFAKSLQDLSSIDLPNYDQLEDAVKALPFSSPEWANGKNLAIVLRGFRALGDEKQLQDTLDMARTHGMNPEHVQIVVADMAAHYASKNDIIQARRWYSLLATAEEVETEQSSQTNFSPILYEKLLRCCLQKNDVEFGDQIVTDMLARPTRPRLRDLVFVWAAGCGKGVDELERMMKLAEESSDGNYEVTVNTMNSLISLALWRGNAYQAERIFHHFEKRGIVPDAHTYVMQMKYRLAERDVDGGLAAYYRLRDKTEGGEEEAGEAVNRLVCAMCGTGRHDFDSIMSIVADLSDSGAEFEPDTVAVLTILHLSRAEVEDATDLLFTHSFQLSIDERQRILKALIRFCKHKDTPNDRAWMTYELLKKTFDDMNREQRTELVDDFLRREQGMSAAQIFEDMRLHTREDTVPLVSTYIETFVAIARTGDREAFEAVYNLLKLDTSIEPNTALYNALMLASVACLMPARALTFWEALTLSAEGPDLSSIQLALRACEVTHGGDNRAREMHHRLKVSGLEMGSQYYAWLLSVLGAHEEVEEGLAFMSQIEQEQGLHPTLEMIGSFVNTLGSTDAQNMVLKWAEEHAPAVCHELEKRLEEVDPLGRRRYRVQDV